MGTEDVPCAAAAFISSVKASTRVFVFVFVFVLHIPAFKVVSVDYQAHHLDPKISKGTEGQKHIHDAEKLEVRKSGASKKQRK